MAQNTREYASGGTPRGFPYRGSPGAVMSLFMTGKRHTMHDIQVAKPKVWSRGVTVSETPQELTPLLGRVPRSYERLMTNGWGKTLSC